MTDKNTPQPVLTDEEIQDIADLFDIYGAKPEFARAIEQAVLSKLRAPVADEQISLRGAANLAFNALHECKPAKGAEKQYSDAIHALQSALHDIAYTVNRTATPQQFADHLQREARAALASAPVADELQPSGNAGELPDAVRVPLDSLHADAGYLVGRALDHSLSRAEVVAVIRSRIDAAKAALASAPVAGEAVLRIYAEGSSRTVTEWLDGARDLPDGDYKLYAAPQASEAAAPKEGKTYAEGYYKGTRDALATESAKRNAGYAGVTVWVGDKQVTQVVTKQLLEASNIDELLSSFDAARLALSAQPGAEPLSNPKQFPLTGAENIRAGAPYDDPAFEALCREHGIWGTAEAALCAVFWRHACKQRADATDWSAIAAEAQVERDAARAERDALIVESQQRAAGTDERTAFEAMYQADYDDPGAACEREHFGKGYRAGILATRHRDDSQQASEPEPKRFVILKESGSRFAYVNDTELGRTVKRFDVLKGDGWGKAERLATRLNAQHDGAGLAAQSGAQKGDSDAG